MLMTLLFTCMSMALVLRRSFLAEAVVSLLPQSAATTTAVVATACATLCREIQLEGVTP
jgi:hypothetical protein